MLLFITIIHLVVAVLLIALVLLQDSKGGGVFGMGASGSSQVLSATGAVNFLVKATRLLAILFAVTCLTLTYMTSKSGSSSVVDGFVPAPTTPVTAPTTPQAPVDTPATNNGTTPTPTQPTNNN